MPRSIHSAGALLVAGLSCSGVLAQGTSTAEYRLTFDAIWSSATHPVQFPNSPHFSGLIGGTHNANAAFWELGGVASPGMKEMAERGRKSPLDSEVESAIQAGDAFAVISGGGISLSPGSVSVIFTASSEFPLMTVVSMIAPSPDWFVGTNGEPLIDGGSWRQSFVVELDPYDAGTDSGATYSAPNQPTSPQEVIHSLIGTNIFAGTPPLGTFTVELIGLECYADCDQTTGLGTLDVFDFLCFQDLFVAGDPAADCDGSTSLDIFDFLCFQDAFTQGCV